MKLTASSIKAHVRSTTSTGGAWGWLELAVMRLKIPSTLKSLSPGSEF